jgi:peptidoglycan/LPS O-acetylase OafA/YrhL
MAELPRGNVGTPCNDTGVDMTDLALRIRKASSSRRQSNFSPAAAAAPKKRHLRSDIQGLRAFAVIVVILDHLLHWPSGGFIGVDIFFVISGFVITESLIREQERTGSISFTGFYKRRVKRILPASTLVLLVTVAASFLAFNQARSVSVAWDALWALFFSGNWHFAAVGTDYFQAAGPVSPLQHFWSLAVEEQFYFVWPWVMLLIFTLLARRTSTGTAARVAIGAAITVICLASFAWALYETTASPTISYFSTLSRAWELGVGALIGVVAPVLSRLPDWLRPFLAWLGVAGMVAALFVVDGGNAFPAPAAALPVLSAALFIVAGTGSSTQKILAPFTNRVSGYLGDISYSLYLWHFPAIVIVAAFMDESPLYYLTAGLGGLAVAVYSYHLVEDPIRKSSWLNARMSKFRDRKPVSTAYTMTALSLLAVVTFAVVVPALMPRSAPVAAVALPKAPAAALETPEVKLSLGVESVQKAITLALNSPTWPEKLTPSLDDPNSGMAAEMGAGCLNPEDASDTEICSTGAGVKTAMVIGDSVAASWAPAVRSALDSESYTTHTVAFSDCPFIQTTVSVPSKPEESKRCNDARPLIAQQLKTLKPALVFIASAEADFNYLGSGKRDDAAVSEWSTAVAASAKLAKASGARVFILASNPQGKSVSSCATRTSSPADCADVVSNQWFLKTQAEEQAAKAAGVTFIDPRTWMCSLDNVCPMFIKGNLVRWDSVHLTEPFATTVAGPLLRETIAPALK